MIQKIQIVNNGEQNIFVKEKYFFPYHYPWNCYRDLSSESDYMANDHRQQINAME